jgi:hypothetical protein
MVTVFWLGELRTQRWLAKALFLVTVTSPPGLVALVVRASPTPCGEVPFSEVMIVWPVFGPDEIVVKHQVVVPLARGFNRTVDPSATLFGTPAKNRVVPEVTKMEESVPPLQVVRWAGVVPALAAPTVAKSVPAASSPAARMEIERRIMSVPRLIFVSVLSSERGYCA